MQYILKKQTNQTETKPKDTSYLNFQNTFIKKIRDIIFEDNFSSISFKRFWYWLAKSC